MVAFRRVVVAAGLAAGLAAAACSSEGVPDDRLEGLVHTTRQPPAAIDVDKAAAQVDELVRAAHTAHRAVTAALGAHAFHGTSSLQVRQDGQLVEDLGDTTRIEVDAAGAIHAQLDNSHDYGRELVFVGGTVYVRPRHSKFHRRPPSDDDEPARFADEIFATLGDYFELVAPGAEVSDQGPVDLQGRRGRRIAVRLAPSPRPPPTENAPERAWRQSVSVSKLDGSLVIDQDTGVPLSGKLDAVASYTRDGKLFEMTIAVTHEVDSVGKVASIAAPPPEDSVATFEVNRESEDRETLLQGIAPPARRPPTPETVPPPRP